jgi:hypothetical protein
MRNEKLSKLIAQAKEERSVAIHNAKLTCAVVRSSGLEIAMLDENEELIEREYGVKMTQRDIAEFVRKWAHCTPKFALSGSVDGADSVYGLNNWDYEPQVECWDGDVFTASEIGVEQVIAEVKS